MKLKENVCPFLKFERNGCKISLHGKFLGSWDTLPNMKEYFTIREWREMDIYAADGPGNSQVGYLKLGSEGEGTFCLSNYETDTTLDSEPIEYKLTNICVDWEKGDLIE